jgi:thymidylate synthase
MYKGEQGYLDLLAHLLTCKSTSNRTGVNTRSMFGANFEFDMKDGRFPLFTTKKVFLRGIAEELFFFIAGDTNSKHLEAKNVNIWKPNSTSEFHSRIGLSHYQPGELGPVYGYQWRYWGKSNYSKIGLLLMLLFICNPSPIAFVFIGIILYLFYDRGHDQLASVISTIKNDPSSRRMIVSAWNVTDIPKMVLPPCHVLYQFHVEDGHLNCKVYQRSADMFLGFPFNVASYALLLMLVAKETGLLPGVLHFSLGDCHIYENHVDVVKEQIKRTPFEFPVLDIQSSDIYKTKYEDVHLTEYQCHDPLKAEMVA